MNENLERMTAGDLTDADLESLNREWWLKNTQLLRLGYYKSKGWRLTIADSFEISWDDFLEVVEDFGNFILTEEEAMRREQNEEEF